MPITKHHLNIYHQQVGILRADALFCIKVSIRSRYEKIGAMKLLCIDIVHLQQVFISQTLSFDLFAFPQTIAFSSRRNVEKTTLNILTSIYFQLLTFFNSCHICHNCISPNSSSTPIQMYRTHQSQSGQLVSPRPHLSHWVSPPSAIASPDLIISQFMQGWLLLYEPDTGKYVMEL